MAAPTPITTDLLVVNQGINIDIESIAPIQGFTADAYDVANMTITATVQSPAEQSYRLVLAADVEAGTDVTANGQKMFHAKCPARTKRIVPTVATTRLRTSAVGFITSGARLKSAIAAR